MMVDRDKKPLQEDWKEKRQDRVEVGVNRPTDKKRPEDDDDD